MEAEKILSKYFRPEMVENPDGPGVTGKHQLVVSSWFDSEGIKQLEYAGIYTFSGAVRLGRFLEESDIIPGSEIITDPPQKTT